MLESGGKRGKLRFKSMHATHGICHVTLAYYDVKHERRDGKHSTMHVKYAASAYS
jgi:hypothetical protein